MLIVKVAYYILNIVLQVLTNGFVFLGKKQSNAFLVYLKMTVMLTLLKKTQVAKPLTVGQLQVL